MSKLNAILLIGPTASGKTPLGDYLQEHGLEGRNCYHFDFGANLRAVEAAGACEGMTDDDLQVVHDALKGGVLLENENFHIAEKLLFAFVKEKGVTGGDIILMNGLPRHVGQAASVDKHISVEKVISLECPAKVVIERICIDTGGDRAERCDDTLDFVEKKLRTFNERTLPLIDHYRFIGADVTVVPVDVDTTAADIASMI